MAKDAEKQRVNIGARLMPATVKALDDAGARMGGKSRAFVIEVLTVLFAKELNAETQIPVGMVPSDSRASPKNKPKE